MLAVHPAIGVERPDRSNGRGLQLLRSVRTAGPDCVSGYAELHRRLRQRVAGAQVRAVIVKLVLSCLCGAAAA